ncbi:MAG: site-specific integrase, partial [Synergistaceae bacterium]|nr:site-specific integrase [Synergistaceae bacterium]
DAYNASTTNIFKRKDTITVSELIDIYEKYCALRPVTRYCKTYILNIIRYMFGTREVRSLSKADLLVWREKFIYRKNSPNTIRGKLSAFKSLTAWGKEKGIIRKDPFFAIRLPARETSRFIPPTNEEISAILRHATPHLQRVIIIGLFTGARIGPSELLSLRWQDIDFKNMVLHMPAARKGQHEKFREIPIREGLLPWLRIWQEHDRNLTTEHVINYDGRSVSSIGSGWRHALRRAGILRRIRPYDLRHAFATNALEAGADIGAVAAIMGHRNIDRILETYQHAREGLCREAIEKHRGIRPDNGHIGRFYYGI